MSSKPTSTHIETGLRAVLRHPAVYNTFGNVIGGNRSRRRHFVRHFSDASIKSVLDIGCGTGVLLDSLRPGIEYHGCDMERSYIEHARAIHRTRATFHLEHVGETIRPEWIDRFDAVNAHGLLHHLTDEDSIELIETGNRYLKPGGFMVTADPVFFPGQSAFSRWIVSKDRGQNVRTPDEYLHLAEKFFPKVESKLIRRNNRIYYSAFVMKMTKDLQHSA